MNRRLLLIAGGASVGLLLVWFLLLWSPKGKELSEAQARGEAAEVVAQQLESRLARLNATQERSTELVATLDRLRSAVPETPNLAQFILDTNDAALQSGVGFLSISPSPPQAPADPTAPAAIALSLTIDGGYFQVLDFVNRLDSLPRIVVIDSITVTPKSENGSSPDLSVALGGRMFTAATTPGAGVPGGPAPTGAADPAAPAPDAPAPSTPSTSIVGAQR